MSNRVSRTVHVLQLGSRMHYAVPRILHENGLLGFLYTDAYIGDKPRLQSLLKSIPRSLCPASLTRLIERAEPSLPSDKIVSMDWLGLQLWIRQRRAKSSSELSRTYGRGNREFSEAAIKRGIGDSDVIYGFNGASLEVFEWAKRRGVRCLLEQTIAPRSIERALLSEEARRWPGWQPDFDIVDIEDDLEVRERREWALADIVVGASKLVVDGLIESGVPAEKTRLLPYGIQLNSISPRVKPRKAFDTQPLCVMFAGEVGLRKGVPYLLQALQSLGPGRVRARLAGKVALSPERLREFSDVAEFLGPLPRSEMTALFEWADVFCLPSICEGSATVTYEAIGHGVPVITTPNSGSLVVDGVNGCIVSIRDAQGLAAALGRYSEDREYLRAHRAGAVAGRAAVGLGRYSEDLLKVVHQLLP